MCEISNLTKGCGERTPGGLRTKLYLVPASEVIGTPRTLKEMTPASTTPGATVLMNEAWQMVTTSGKGFWREFDVVIDKSSVVFTAEGDKGNKSIKNGLRFSLASTGIEVREFVENYVNCCHVAMIASREEPGQYLVIGRHDDPAFLEELEGGSGANSTEFNGFNFTIGDSTGLISRSYPAALGVDLTPAP
jgi:hypothetical protein